MPSEQALEIAYQRELDLVLISPQAKPPVCRIMDYGKFRFEQSKKEKEARKNQRIIEIKEIRMSPGIGENDFNTKLKNGQKFLQEGDRVKVTVRFRGREMAHTNIGEQLLVSFADGTYAWGQEGDFYLHILPEPNSTLAPFLRNVFYNQGRFYSIWEAFQNLIWYLLLFGSCIGGFIALRRKECSPTIIALFLSLLGISAYVMTFESRARYLFIYAPVFLLTAAYSVLPRWQQSNK